MLASLRFSRIFLEALDELEKLAKEIVIRPCYVPDDFPNDNYIVIIMLYNV